jgi:hypothetical protein
MHVIPLERPEHDALSLSHHASSHTPLIPAKAGIQERQSPSPEHGFTIDRADVIRETNEFVWIVSYDGPEDWEAKQAAYYGSPERKAVSPDPARHIAKARRWFIEPVVPAK